MSIQKKPELPAKKDAVSDVRGLLVSQKSQILAALPKHFSSDRFIRIALTEIRKNPELGRCDPYSFLGAVIQSAQLGLEVGSGLGHAFLVPFRNKTRGITEVQLIPGYKGLIDLARRSGHIETISARIVRERDFFEFAYGDDEKIVHVPYTGPDDPGTITMVYAIARLKGGGIQREVMSRAQIDRTRDRANKNPVWETDFDEMARKTAVRRICKYLPLSPELCGALEADNANHEGESQENWRFLDAEYEPLPAAHDPEKIKEVSGGAPAAVAFERLQVAKSNLLKEVDRLSAAGYIQFAIEKAMGLQQSQIMSSDDYQKILNVTDILRDMKSPAKIAPKSPAEPGSPKSPESAPLPPPRPGAKAYALITVLNTSVKPPPPDVLERLAKLKDLPLQDGDDARIAQGARLGATKGDFEMLDDLIKLRIGT